MFLFLFALAIGFSLLVQHINAQVITNSGSGLAATYPSLADAITALNAASITGPVVITLTGNETAPAGGYQITQAGGSSVNTIIIQGISSILTAFTPQAAGNLNDAIIKLVGADWVTISGFTLQENPANTTTTTATNTMTEWGVALLYAGLTNGCQHNTIQNNIISLNRTYLNTFGIYSNTRHSATNVTTVAEVTSATGSDSFNKVYGNAISNVNYGIVFIGAGTTGAAIDNGNDIGGTAAGTANTISNYGGGTAPTLYVSLVAGDYGINLNQQINDNISFNNITSASGLLTTTVAMTGIFKNYSVAQPTGTITTTINSNTITLTTFPTTGAMTGINNTGLTALGTATVNINNNSILNCSIGSGATSAAMTGIANTSVPGTLNINNNIIRGNTTSATTGAFTGISNTGAIVTSCNINNNQLGDNTAGVIYLTAPTTNVVYLINNTGGAVTCAQSISGNNFQGVSYGSAGTGAFRCISQTAKVLSSTFNNNNFNNLTINTSGQLTGMFIYGSNATPTVTIIGNNVTTQFSNINTTGFTNQNYAIYNLGSPTSGTSTISGNNLSNITVKNNTNYSGGFSVIAWLAGGVGATSTHSILIDGNTISNVSNTSTGNSGQSAGLYGIQFAYGYMNVISNNVVSNLTAAGGTAIGIYASNTSPNPAGTTTIRNNVIHDIKSTSVYNTDGFAVGNAIGLQIQSGPSANTVYKNKIYDISCVTPGPNQAGTAIGIVISQGTATCITTIYNNYIGRLYAENSINPQSVAGIWSWNNVSNTTNIYFNTIHLDGNVPGYSYCFLANSETPNIDLRNNILINKCAATGSFEQMILFVPSLTASYLSTSNNNILYCGTPGPLHIIYADGISGALTNIQQTLSGFQTFAGPTRESDSKSENVPLANIATGAGNDYLHITPGATTVAESGAVNITGITDDYDSDIRQGNTGYIGTGTAPDIGADEFSASKTLALTLYLESLYAGGATMNRANDENGPHFGLGIADKITVELHDGASYATIITTVPDIDLHTNGTAILPIPFFYSGSYYVTVKHRNSIQTVSAAPVSFASGIIQYDLTNNSNKAYGDNMLLMLDGKYVLYGGDVNQDDIVDSGDMMGVDNLSAASATGYLPEDANGDGLVDSSDMMILDNNSSLTVSAAVPM